MSRVELSDRLKCIAEMVLPESVIYDVGCDHGFLSIYLIEEGIAKSAVALDIVEGPLKAAKEHVYAAGLSDRIECRLSDGLHNITSAELDCPDNKTLVIAGMGGPLILKILDDCPEIRDLFDELIVGPQSKIEEFRRGLESRELVIIDENMIFEDGKYYQILKMKKTKKCAYGAVKESGEPEGHLKIRAIRKYGKILLERKTPVLFDYLNYEYRILTQVRESLDEDIHADRYRQVCEDIEINRLAVGNMFSL